MAYTEVLLTENVPNLGAEADIVKVRRGYARNFLIPRGAALELNASALRRVNHLKAKRAEREAREVTAAEEVASKINKLKLTFDLETGETGKAFGSITSKDIHDRLQAELANLELAKHAVELERPIKETGSHEVAVRVHADVIAKLTITVAAPKAAEAEEEEDADGKKRAPRRKSSTEA